MPNGVITYEACTQHLGGRRHSSVLVCSARSNRAEELRRRGGAGSRLPETPAPNWRHAYSTATRSTRSPDLNSALLRRRTGTHASKRVTPSTPTEKPSGAGSTVTVFGDEPAAVARQAIRRSICARRFAAQSFIGNPGLVSHADSIKAIRGSTASP
jgi:hypothetical protein